MIQNKDWNDLESNIIDVFVLPIGILIGFLFVAIFQIIFPPAVLSFFSFGYISDYVIAILFPILILYPYISFFQYLFMASLDYLLILFLDIIFTIVANMF